MRKSGKKYPWIAFVQDPITRAALEAWICEEKQDAEERLFHMNVSWSDYGNEVNGFVSKMDSPKVTRIFGREEQQQMMAEWDEAESE